MSGDEAGKANEGQLKTMSVNSFLRRLSIAGKGDQHAAKLEPPRYAFFLGAGCSKSSGIPTAGELVNDRWLPLLRELEAPENGNIKEWAKAEFKQYKPETAAAFYGEVMGRLFPFSAQRRGELERLCSRARPAFGYNVLAQLVAHDNQQFNIVLTTNFDDLVAEALYLTTQKWPLVIHHEALAEFIRPSRLRPLIVKLHGDYRLAPRNTETETATLEAKTALRTQMALDDRGLIFLGYGGNDESILKLLEDLPEEALPHGVYWVSPHEPNCKLNPWLKKRGAFWVQIPSFDAFMLLLLDMFKLPHPGSGRFDRIFEAYAEQFKEVRTEVDGLADADADSQRLKDAAKRTAESFPDYWWVMVQARAIEKEYPDQAERIYEEGCKRFPNAAYLLGAYAFFLANVRKEHTRAEAMYHRAIQAEPQDADILGSYANFLSHTMKDDDRAATLYKQAIQADRNHANNLCNYAIFLTNRRKDYSSAEEYYRRAIEADPDNGHALGNYAYFLHDVRKEDDKAQDFYNLAVEASPKDATLLSNFALFLKDARQDFDLAEDFHKRATEAAPKDPKVLNNYAAFLATIRKDYAQAETFYRRATEADPKHAASFCNYASLLAYAHKDYPRAEELYKKAIELEPKSVPILVNYAGFLFILGHNNRANHYLDEAIGLAQAPETKTRHLIRAWFYTFVHGPANQRGTALAKIKTLLSTPESRPPYSDYAPNIEQAQKDNHPDAEWLPKLADVINDRAKPDTLDDWEAWQNAAKPD